MKRWLKEEKKQQALPNSLKAVEILDNQIIGRQTEGILRPVTDQFSIDLHYQGWPTVCKGDSDTLYAVSSLRRVHIDPFGCVAFYKSKDAGKTWSDAKVIHDTPLDDRDAGILYLGNGRLLVTSFRHAPTNYVEGGKWSQWRNGVTEEAKLANDAVWEVLPEDEKKRASYILLSEDDGETWSEPIKVPVSCPHGPTLMNDGKTIIYLGDIHCDPNECEGFTAEQFPKGHFHVIQSEDAGKSWKYRSSIKLPELVGGYFDEPHIIQLDDGSFIGALRAGVEPGNAGLRIFLTYSEDGYTWTEPKMLEGTIGTPPHLVQLSNGVVVLSYGYRLNPTGARARLSYDGGKTWTDEIVISTCANPASGDLGYSSTAELEDGSLITAYYQKSEADTFCSLLYTTWKLVEKD